MHWQEAVAKSEDGRARRTEQDGRTMFRWKDGSGSIEKMVRGGFFEAERDQLDGYDDWEPA